MKIAVCDDDREVCREVFQILKEYFSESKSYSNSLIKVFETGRDMLESEMRFDVIFLDIDMSEMNGIETAKILREWDVDSKIIYLTNYSNYGNYAYQVHAFDYLCKPVNKKVIFDVLNEAIRYSENRNTSCKCFFKTHEGNISIEIDEIYYFEYCVRRIEIVCSMGKYTSTTYSLGQLYEKLYKYNFEMPHKSFIVNMPHIKRIKNFDVFMDNGDIVPLAQKRAVMFKERFNNFLQSTFELV